MTVKELAGILSGREYGGEIYPLEERNAQADGLVVVYGYSDDNVEFRGAIDDEVGAYEGITIHINKSGILYAPTPECDMDECPYLKQAVKKARSIRAVWHDEGTPCWTFETDIPHETFDIYEDGELFCVGIVFALDDIQTKTPNDPLTLEELREMDGEPVYVVLDTKNHLNKRSGWKVVEIMDDEFICFTDGTICSLYYLNFFRDWLAYRRKPEEGTI